MTLKILAIGPALALLPVVGAVSSDAADSAHVLNAKQQAELDKVLAGKVAGKPVSCIDATRQPSLRVISDDVIVYTDGRRTAYRNDLIGRCPGLKWDDIPVIHSFGSRYCRGDFIRMVSRTSGIGGGGCALGSFTPYKTPPAS